MLNTPLLHAKGVYEVATPWVIPAGTIYECIAIRSFRDLEKLGEDVFDAYYNTHNLSTERYQQDRIQNANIITLASSTHPTIYIPDTFITKFPDLNNVAYKLVVLSVDLGPLPDGLDLTFLQDQIQGVVSNVTGVIPTVQVHAAPSTGVITEAKHQALEAARQAAVETRTTDYAELQQANETIGAMRQKLDAFEAIWKAQGQLPP